MSTERLRRFCVCGGTLAGTASPAGLADALLDAFDREHTGDGHGPATPAQAARARARMEDEHLTWDGMP